jgi:hypothetical protein
MREQRGGCFLGSAFGNLAKAVSFVQHAELQRRAEDDLPAAAAAVNKKASVVAAEEGGVSADGSRRLSDESTRVLSNDDSGYVSDLSTTDNNTTGAPVHTEAAALVPAAAPGVDNATLLQVRVLCVVCVWMDVRCWATDS